MKDKVVVTGINVISALGLSISETWKNLLEGKNGVKKISLFDPVGLETQIAAELPEGFDEYSKKYIKKRMAKQMTRVTQMNTACVKACIEENEIDFDYFDKDRCAVILGILSTGNSSLEKDINPKNSILKGMNNAVAAWISIEYGFQGPSYTVATACASSAYAIANAYDLISRGNADLVIVGGSDSIINPEEISGFNSLFALSTNNEEPSKASRPFSRDRDGFVIGEGAGILILESEKSALKRKAKIYAEIAGYALLSEAYNIMSPSTDGVGMAKTMENALKNSGVQKSEINYINAHGTSTILNDLYESKAIKTVFGDHAKNIAISSTKSMLGHTIAAAGAIETAITVQSVYDSKVHPTINLINSDPELDLDYVPNKSRELDISCAISNSFGFGGHNSSIVIKKY